MRVQRKKITQWEYNMSPTSNISPTSRMRILVDVGGGGSAVRMGENNSLNLRGGGYGELKRG
jgi:hypothetical protein